MRVEAYSSCHDPGDDDYPVSRKYFKLKDVAAVYMRALKALAIPVTAVALLVFAVTEYRVYQENRETK